MMLWHQATTAHAVFRISWTGWTTLNEFDAWPHAAGILPSATRSANPFSQNRTSRHDATIGFFKLTAQCRNLARRPHAHRDQTSQQVSGYSQSRTFGDIVDSAGDFQAQAGSDHTRKHVRDFTAATFHAGRNQPGSNHRAFDEAEIVAAKVEYFIDVMDFDFGIEINADEA